MQRKRTLRGRSIGAVLVWISTACSGAQPAASVPGATQARARAVDTGLALNEDELSVFARLAKEIGNARVVALGESSHYGAATFELKLKLVQYLHTELGFDRIML